MEKPKQGKPFDVPHLEVVACWGPNCSWCDVAQPGLVEEGVRCCCLGGDAQSPDATAFWSTAFFFLGLARSPLSPTATFWSLNLPIANRGHCGQLNISQAVGGGTHAAELGLLWPVTPKRWKEKKKLPIYLSPSQPQVVVVIWEEYSGKVAFLFTFIVFVKPLKISRNPC